MTKCFPTVLGGRMPMSPHTPAPNQYVSCTSNSVKASLPYLSPFGGVQLKQQTSNAQLELFHHPMTKQITCAFHSFVYLVTQGKPAGGVVAALRHPVAHGHGRDQRSTEKGARAKPGANRLILH